MRVLYKLFFSCFCIVSLNADSLWDRTPSRCSMFADVRARAIGDIVLVTFGEAKEDSKGQETTLKIAANSATEPSKKYPFLQRILNVLKDRGHPITLPTPYAFEEKTYTITNIAMQVMDVLPNGNLVLEGVRKFKFFDVYKFEVIRGIARQQDISDKNQLDSSLLAHMTVDYGTGHSLEEAKQNGLMTKINNFLNIY